MDIKNLIANFSYRSLNTLFSFILAPFLLNSLGAEAYSFIGFYFLLCAFISFLDLGISSLVTREISAYRAQGFKNIQIGSFSKTFEIYYWVISVFLLIIVVLSAKPLSTYWLHPVTFSETSIQFIIYLLAFAMLFNGPLLFYNAALLGLDKQVALNGINLAMGILKNLGLVFFLLSKKFSIETFFLWQFFLNIIHVFLIRAFFWKNIPHTNKPQIKLRYFVELKKILMGLCGISASVLILSYLDKCVLSHLLDLKTFGYYTLSSSIAMGLQHITAPFLATYFPRFSELIAKKNEGDLIRTYHRASQYLAGLLIPFACILIFFPKEILLLWSKNEGSAVQCASLIRFLSMISFINGMCTLPYAIQLSYGYLRVAFIQNLISIVVLIPLFLFGVEKYGIESICIVWVALTLINLMINVNKMHGKFLKKEKVYWYINDWGVPMIIALLFFSIAKWNLMKLVFNSFLFSNLIIATFLITIFTIGFYIRFLNKWHAKKLLIKL